MLKLSHSTRKLVIFSQASVSSAPPLTSGLLATMPTVRPPMRDERRDRHLAEARLELEEAVLVDDGADDAAHVVDLRALGRQQLDDVAHAVARPGGTGRSGGASLACDGR